MVKINIVLEITQIKICLSLKSVIKVKRKKQE